MVDLLKVVASQVILWHHFCRYGPLARTLELAGYSWVSFIGQHGRHAVQVFLVVSGFLSARAIGNFLQISSTDSLLIAIKKTWLARAWRLAIPYWLMLLVAVAFAGFSRHLQVDIDTPAAPQWHQWLAHIFLIQNFLSIETLSTGVWYVAIDLQLSFLLLAVVFLCSKWTARDNQLNPKAARHAIEAMIWLFMLLALFGFNRWQSADVWAVYFFGSFGIGLTAGLRPREKAADSQHFGAASLFWLTLMSFVGAALWQEWRPGLLVGLLCALMLWRFHDGDQSEARRSRMLNRLSRDSYALFLFHYPVVLLTGSVVNYIWPIQSAAALLGLAASWIFAMIVAFTVSLALDRHNDRSAKKFPLE
jgi:peptidoglycan/LPS O-acetylase OafA/YrhL